MRLIDVDALADALFEKRKNYPQWVADTIGNMPTIDVLALLKEQEAVEPGLMQDAKGIWNTCGKCGHILKSAFINPMDENDTFFYFPKFCSECGKAVNWK